MNKVAVVILNWNGKHFLEKFLPSIIKFSNYQDCKIIIADNASTDKSVEFTKNNFPQIEIIELEKNFGFAEGYNQALNKVHAEYFVLLNSDVEVTENWLNPVIDFMEKNKNVAVCMPKIKSYHQKDTFEYAGASGGFIDKFAYPFCRGRIINKLEKDNGQYDDNINIFWATGACFFIRADLYKKVGGLDKDFFAHMEEIDLCWRLKNMNYEIFCIPKSTVYHVGGGTLSSDSPKKLFFNFRNNLFLLYKNLAQEKLIKTIFIRMCLDGLAALVYLLSFRFSYFYAVLKAHIEFYKNLKNLSVKRKKLLPFYKKYEHKTILNKSILYLYFFKKKAIFREINFFNKIDSK